MNTKIIYVIVSSDSDIYLEQAWVSIYSLRHFNKDVRVEIICDDRTAERIQNHLPHVFKMLVDNVVTVPFEEEVSNRERSRWLKTNMRNLVDGNFLFLDTDTIVTDSLEEIDSFDCNIGMVYSWHCRLSDRPNNKNTFARVETLYGVKIKEGIDYFNSGVIYCKDTKESHAFFDKWHIYWESGKDKPRGIQDQQSLIATINDLGGVEPISGIYNCQPLYSMKYLTSAKIVHFFNLEIGGDPRSLFNKKDFYLEIKKEGLISDKNKNLILNCRSTFVAPSLCICGDDIEIWRSSTFKMLRRIYAHHRFLYRGLNFLSIKLGGIKTHSF